MWSSPSPLKYFCPLLGIFFLSKMLSRSISKSMIFGALPVSKRDGGYSKTLHFLFLLRLSTQADSTSTIFVCLAFYLKIRISICLLKRGLFDNMSSTKIPTSY